MRKIETQMNQPSLKNVIGNSTILKSLTSDNVSFVYLYHNLIAMVADTWLEIFDGGHQTATTKSRLNAILSAHGNGERVYAKNFNWFVSTNEGEVPFNGSIKLD
jgi:hypothetical protein